MHKEAATKTSDLEAIEIIREQLRIEDFDDHLYDDPVDLVWFIAIMLASFGGVMALMYFVFSVLVA